MFCLLRGAPAPALHVKKLDCGRPGDLIDGPAAPADSDNVDHPLPPGRPQAEPIESTAFSSDLITAAWDAELRGDPDRDFLLNGVRYGFRLTCPSASDNQPNSTFSQNYFSADSNRLLVEQQVREEVANGRYVKVSNKPDVISALGAIPKGNNKIRLIHDCSQPPDLSLNSRFSSDYQIKFETVSQFTAKLQPGWFMAKVDLANAYRSVGISPHDFRYTGLQWKFSDQPSPTYLCDTRLPFGAAASVEVFHRLSQSIKRMMQRRGFRNIGSYLDDFAVAAETEIACQQALDTLLHLLRRLGFSINWSKVAPPCTRLVYLGVMIDTNSGLLELPKDKLEVTKAQLQSALSHKRITKRQLQSLCGRINWVCQVVRIGRCFLRPLLLELNKLKQHCHKLRMHNDLRETILWWVACLAKTPSCRIWRTAGPAWAIESDASDWGGCGIIRGPGVTNWLIIDWQRDSQELETLHINFKESLAPVFTALHFQQKLQPGSNLVIYSDSTAAVGAINKGSSPNPIVNTALQQLALLAAHRDLVIQAFHVPGTFQIFADSGSRADDTSELANFLLRLYGTVDIETDNLHEHTLSSAARQFLSLQIARLRSRVRTSAAATTSSAAWPSQARRRAPTAARLPPGNASVSERASTAPDRQHSRSRTTSSCWPTASHRTPALAHTLTPPTCTANCRLAAASQATLASTCSSAACDASWPGHPRARLQSSQTTCSNCGEYCSCILRRTQPSGRLSWSDSGACCAAQTCAARPQRRHRERPSSLKTYGWARTWQSCMSASPRPISSVSECTAWSCHAFDARRSTRSVRWQRCDTTCTPTSPSLLQPISSPSTIAVVSCQ